MASISLQSSGKYALADVTRRVTLAVTQEELQGDGWDLNSLISMQGGLSFVDLDGLLLLALLCATAQQSYCHHAGVRRRP